jgi:DNA-binding response OmpR family regulator
MYVKQAAPTAEITVARDAQQALEAFRKKPPRLVFLDLMMPKTSGFELFTYLRGVHLVDASTVVAMSAGGSPTDVQLMLELGAHDFIPKGPELRGRVTRIVGMLAKAQ